MDKNKTLKKKKIRQLEAEIADMQRDHAATFGYTPSRNTASQHLDAIIFVLGIALLCVGLLWIFSNFNISAGLAVLRIGSLRFSKSIFSLPMIMGIFALIFCSKRKIPIIVTIFGAAFSLIGLIINAGLSALSKPLWLYAVMLSVTFMGLLLTALTVIKIKKSNIEAKKQ